MTTERVFSIAVWQFLAQMYSDDTWPDSDPQRCVSGCWSDHKVALKELTVAYLKLDQAQTCVELYGQLEEESYEHFEVSTLTIREHFKITKTILNQGIKVCSESS